MTSDEKIYFELLQTQTNAASNEQSERHPLRVINAETTLADGHRFGGDILKAAPEILRSGVWQLSVRSRQTRSVWVIRFPNVGMPPQITFQSVTRAVSVSNPDLGSPTPAAESTQGA